MRASASSCLQLHASCFIHKLSWFSASSFAMRMMNFGQLEVSGHCGITARWEQCVKERSKMNTPQSVQMCSPEQKAVARPAMIIEHDMVKLETAKHTFVFGLDCLGYQCTTDATSVAERVYDRARVVGVTCDRAKDPRCSDAGLYSRAGGADHESDNSNTSPE